MDPAGDSCYNCRRPLREIDFRQGRAIRVGSLASCERCAEPLLARLTPEQRAAIFRKLEGEPPPEEDAAVEILPPDAAPQAHATSHRLRPPAPRPAPTAHVHAPPPAAPDRKTLTLLAAGVGALLLIVVLALWGGSGREEVKEAAPRRVEPVRVAAPTATDRRAEEESLRREALQGDIAALEKTTRSRTEAQEYQKALDALEAVRPRHNDASWTQAVDRLAREIGDSAEGQFVRMKSRLMDAQSRGDRDEVGRLRDEVTQWGMPKYLEETKKALEAVAARASEGLVCWLKLDESSGRSAADASGNGCTGTLGGGAAWKPGEGRIGGAAAFDGRDACIVIRRPVQDDFTIAFWMKTTQDWGGNQWYEGAGLVDGECPGTGNDFGTALVQGRFACGNGGRNDRTVTSSRKVNDGAWHHVAATRVRSTGMVRLFVDGAPAGSGSCDTPSLTAPSRLTIGCIQTNGNYYEGLIDDLRIYSRALSMSEVGTLADAAGPAPAGAAALPPGGAPAASPEPPPVALTEAEKAAGWRLLFDGRTTDGWRAYNSTAPPQGWRVENGLLVSRDGKDIVFQEPFASFELALEWRVAPGGDSGIIYRVSESTDPPFISGPEMQIADNAEAGICCRMYMTPAPAATRPVGQWNQVRLVADGSRAEHWLNGVKVCAYEIGSEDWNRRLSDTGFRPADRLGRNARGLLCLQGARSRVEFRNIRIRILP